MEKRIYVLALLSLVLGCDHGATSSDESKEDSLESVVGEHKLELKSENADLETELICPSVEALLVIERGVSEPEVISLKGYVEYSVGSYSYFLANIEVGGNLTDFSSVSQTTSGEADDVKTSVYSSNEIDFDFDFQEQDQYPLFDPNIIESLIDAPPVLKIEGNIFGGGIWVREGEGLLCSGQWKLDI